MLRFECVQQLEQAEKLWKFFSPEETIYDSWEFRYCFYKYFNYPLYFYAGYENEELIGVLPLQFNVDKQYLEFFGGDYMEDNRVMVKTGYENNIPEFYQQISRTAQLGLIRGSDAFTTQLPKQDFKYVLPLNKFKTSDEYLVALFHSETRKTIQKKVRRIERENMKVILNKLEDIELLFEYNKAMFKEKSSFNDRPHHQEIFRDLLVTPFKPYLLSFVIGEEVQGVTFSLLYKKSYAYISLGVYPKAVKDLVNFMNIKNIEQALGVGATEVDAFTGDYGWKERWHFSKIPQYKFENKV